MTSSSSNNDFQTCRKERRQQLHQTRTIWSMAESLTSNNNSNTTASESFRLNNQQHFIRLLNATELQTLQTTCGCKSQDWSKICLLLQLESSRVQQSTEIIKAHLAESVSNTTFSGIVVLYVNSSSAATATTSPSLLEPWNKALPGIHNNFLISNSILSTTQTWVHGNSVISDTHILPESVVVSCGSMTASVSDSFLKGGNNTHDHHDDGSILHLTVGPESGGGRQLALFPECDMIQVCRQLTNPEAVIIDTITGKKSASTTTMNIISSHCLVRNTPTVQGIYMAPQSSIQGATSVSDTILFPTSTIQNSCIVDNARLQWKASITDNSKVSDVMLMEEAHIGPNSFVASSVLGPDVHVSAGEVHCSIIGPNTNAHHQSLVISVLWPLGRGNVGYGANIGSNHTGRIPDQETSSGEGVFWGLSCVIKFPVDLTMAPYSIVAAGTTMPPQRVCMPFSLIVSSNNGGNNNIIPGWVLSSSPYTVARSETKYATRRKAIRHKHYTGWKIIRPETIAMCCWARKQLQSVTANVETSMSTIYATDRAIKGIGSNVLSEKGRRSGIKTYSDSIQKFALEGMLSWLTQQNETQGRISEDNLRREFQPAQFRTAFFNLDMTYDQVTWPTFPWETNSDQLWGFQKQLLLEEFPCTGTIIEWVCELLQALVVLENAYAVRIFKCKKRDDQRGAATVPGYPQCHAAAEFDPVIVQANKDAKGMEQSVARFITIIKSIVRSKL